MRLFIILLFSVPLPYRLPQQPIHYHPRPSGRGHEWYRLLQKGNPLFGPRSAGRASSEGSCYRAISRPTSNSFVRIATEVTDFRRALAYKAVYYVPPDYLSVGNTCRFLPASLLHRWRPKRSRNGLHYFLPTCKMSQDIYQQSVVKLGAPSLCTQAYRD